MKKLILFLIIILIIVSCKDAYVASRNISEAADQFEIFRRVVFYNGITDKYILMVEGFCSINVDNIDKQLELIIKTDEGEFIKHYLGLSDNVTYFAEQLDTAKVSVKHYRVIFKPSIIIPNIDIE